MNSPTQILAGEKVAQPAVPGPISALADVERIETEMPFDQRVPARTVYQLLQNTCAAHGARPAVSFQLMSGPKDKSTTLTWDQVAAQVRQAANLFRSLGVAENDTVAYLLPSTHDTLITMLGGMTAGKVAPINPTLEPAHISALLRETGAKVLVTLKSFPKSDLTQQAHDAVAEAPNVKTVIEIDLLPNLSGLKKLIVPMVRPKVNITHTAQVLDFHKSLRQQPADRLTFSEPDDDRFCALFHTGGTTGMPKIAQHRHSGILYNGWMGSHSLFSPDDVLLCPLPLFHVMASYPIWMGALSTGAHVVFPTPGGYRGEGVFENFWKLIERYGVTFMVTVPTAAAAIMQRPVNADVSTLKAAFSGSAPLPQELYKRFVAATGVEIQEGYGMTEATCVVSSNPRFGERRIGSVGYRMPYTEVRILNCDEAGNILSEPATGEIGEICVSSPGVMTGETYTDPARNVGLYADGRFLRTGDLGRIDSDGYLWITGRAKDLIIRGGHNVDPALIEDGLAGHPDVAFVGAIGQPDEKTGELPCAYVELVAGATTSVEELMIFAAKSIPERAAHPKYLEILPELPKTAVGKVFKPALRKMAITRVYDAALSGAGVKTRVDAVVEDKKLGLVAELVKTGPVTDEAVQAVLGGFTRAWRWSA